MVILHAGVEDTNKLPRLIIVGKVIERLGSYHSIRHREVRDAFSSEQQHWQHLFLAELV